MNAEDRNNDDVDEDDADSERWVASLYYKKSST